MIDDGWEARMAARAHRRAERREAARQAEEAANDPHHGHHIHLDGTSVECSCGMDRGVVCAVIDVDIDPDTLSCDLCGKRGLVRLGRDAQ